MPVLDSEPVDRKRSVALREVSQSCIARPIASWRLTNYCVEEFNVLSEFALCVVFSSVSVDCQECWEYKRVVLTLPCLGHISPTYTWLAHIECFHVVLACCYVWNTDMPTCMYVYLCTFYIYITVPMYLCTYNYCLLKDPL